MSSYSMATWKALACLPIPLPLYTPFILLGICLLAHFMTLLVPTDLQESSMSCTQAFYCLILIHAHRRAWRLVIQLHGQSSGVSIGDLFSIFSMVAYVTGEKGIKPMHVSVVADIYGVCRRTSLQGLGRLNAICIWLLLSITTLAQKSAQLQTWIEILEGATPLFCFSVKVVKLAGGWPTSGWLLWMTQFFFSLLCKYLVYGFFFFFSSPPCFRSCTF